MGLAPPGELAFQLPVSPSGTSPEGREAIPTLTNLVGPGFFETTGVSLVRGRGFTADEVSRGAAAAVINLDLADRLWPNENPLGRHVTVAPPTYSWNIQEKRRAVVVGVAANTAVSFYWRRPQPNLYLPMRWYPSGTAHLPAVVLARTEGTASKTEESVRRTIRTTDPDIPLRNVRTASKQWSDSERADRLPWGRPWKPESPRK